MPFNPGQQAAQQAAQLAAQQAQRAAQQAAQQAQRAAQQAQQMQQQVTMAGVAQAAAHARQAGASVPSDTSKGWMVTFADRVRRLWHR